jgi:AraC family transcriptional regulator
MKCYGVCHAFDHDNHMHYLAAAEVSDAGQVAGYLYTLTIPVRKVAVFGHRGSVDTISETWALIFSEGLNAANLTLAEGPQFEVYPEDIGVEGTAPTIEIHIPVA